MICGVWLTVLAIAAVRPALDKTTKQQTPARGIRRTGYSHFRRELLHFQSAWLVHSLPTFQHARFKTWKKVPVSQRIWTPPPRIWTPRSRSASGFGLGGPNPLADMDPLSRIWTPLKSSVLLSKIGKIVFWSC